MKTIRLEIADIAGAADYALALADHASNARLASATLPRLEVSSALWSPSSIREGFANAANPTPDLEAMGRQLGAWVCRNPVREQLMQLRAEEPVRVLLDVKAEDLSNLPWELIRCENIPDFLSKQKPFARLHATKHPAPQADWPLRVLVVVGAAEDDDIAAEAEVVAIERSLHPYGHSIDREVLRRPSKNTLFAMLRDFMPHVFVFIGHCDSDGVSKNPLLRFTPGAPHNWNWGPDEIALDLDQTDWCPSLVLLNACKTWEPAASFKFSDAFIEAGVPACIMMQGDVRGDLAGQFSAQVLRYICEGEPLDIAVAQARNDTRNLIGGLDRRDWAFPVLSVAQNPDALFPDRPQCACKGALAVANIFREVQFFADRRDIRRRIRSRLPVLGPATSQGQLVVVVGGRRCGKSHVVKWCLEHFALIFDATVRYVPLASSGPGDFVSLLRRIRDGDGSGLGALSMRAFDPFHWNLNRILAGQIPGPWNGELADDENAVFDPAVVKYEHAIPNIFSAFRDALAGLSKQRKVVIVLDQFRDANGVLSIEQSVFRDMFVPHLLRPVLEGRLPGLMVAVVIETSDCPHFGIDTLLPASEWIRVDPDLPDPHEVLARELLWYPRDETFSDFAGAIQSIAKKMRLGPRDRTPIDFIWRLRNVVSSIYSDEAEMRAELEVRQMG